MFTRSPEATPCLPINIAIKLAGPTAKTAPTITRRTTLNTRIICLTKLPKYIPVNSETDAPSCRILKKPTEKSCTPPPKIVPNVIHRNTDGPHCAPDKAP